MDEPTLIQQARRDPAAFASLYQRYVERIYAFAHHLTGETALAEDITAATFEKALRKLAFFRWQGISFGAWLYRIARNEINQHYRGQKRYLALTDDLMSDLNLEKTIYRHEQQVALQHALSQLKLHEQELIALRFFEELSTPEVAEILGCSVNQVYVRLHRTLKKLRQSLDQLEPQERTVYVAE